MNTMPDVAIDTTNALAAEERSEPRQTSSVQTRCSACGRALAPSDAFVPPTGAARCAPCEWGEMNRKALAGPQADRGFFAPERAGIRKGVIGGLVMMAIAAIWFFFGLAADRVFFYPPILFLIGLYGLLKGVATGNLAGRG